LAIGRVIGRIKRSLLARTRQR